VLTSGTTAIAQSPEDIARAQQRFDEAEAAESAGNCQLAVEKFREALTVKETAQIQLRIGRCEERLGHLANALSAFQRADELAGDNAKIRELAKNQVATIEPRVPQVILSLPDAVANVTVTLDGKAVQLPAKVSVDPGRHVVEARATGKRPFEEAFELQEGARKNVVIQLVAEETIAPPPPLEVPSEGPDVAPFVLFGVGGALAIVSVGLSINYAIKRSEYFEVCPDPLPDGRQGGCTQSESDVSSLRTEIDVSSGVAWASGALAAGAIATGAILLVLDDGGEVAQPLESTRVIPWGGRFGAGLQVERSF
jgi:hypothetical protein